MKVLGWGKRSLLTALCASALGLVAAGCGSSRSSDSNAAATVKHVESGPTEASLQPVGGSGVSGKAVYLEKPNGLPLLKIRLQDLRKATGETQYFIWKMISRHKMLTIGSYHISHGSRLSLNLKPSLGSLFWLEGTNPQLLITRMENDDRFYASQEHWPSPEDPTEIGVPVARGTFTGPLVGATDG